MTSQGWVYQGSWTEYRAFLHVWGCSSPGRALEWHSRGKGFDPPHLHHENHNILIYLWFFYIVCHYVDTRKVSYFVRWVQRGCNRLPFGFGLSYTDFEYSGLTLDKAELADTDTLTVTCKVKNTGKVAGKESVQLYVRDVESSVGKPLRELKGFVKVDLQPSEEKAVSFTLDKRAFAYYEPKIHDWFVESGTFIVDIGVSSRDIRLSGEVQVNDTSEIPIIFSRDTAIGIVMRHPKGQGLVASMSKNSVLAGGENAIPSDMADSGMIQAMPLGGLMAFGVVTPEQLDGMIAMLNS